MSDVVGFLSPDGPNGYLSNWYAADFALDGQAFLSVEQCMMYRKACLFHDTDTAAQVLCNTEPAEIKRLGRIVNGYSDTIWNGLRQLIVYEAVLAKFEQNADLTAFLLATKHSFLAECNAQDTLWGIGLSLEDPRRFNLAAWQGQNLLGFTLMQVRSRLSGKIEL